jgi:tetratricopeptide (TPR) repeat protein
VKWFLIGSVCLFCSNTWLRADPAGDLYTQGVAALTAGQYDNAAADFDKIIADTPTFPGIDDVQVRAGYAYLQAGKYPEAVQRLSKEIAPDAKPLYRANALYFTALAQFSAGQKDADPAEGKSWFTNAVATFGTLIDLVTNAPTADNKAYLEQSIYYRALSQFELEDYADAEKDLLTLVQQFNGSLSQPDYLLRLGGVYAVEASQALTTATLDSTKEPDTTAVKQLATKALGVFDQVSKDPNALVQANEANMSKAGVLFLLAQMSSSPDDYEAALEAFRLVHRKDDMIAIQQKRVDELKNAAQAKVQDSLTSGAAPDSLSSEDNLLIEREVTRLEDLKTEPDPIIQALIRMAECYAAMKQPDEARTILHRLIAHATLTPDQQQEVDFQVLYSYVLGGQTDQANQALTDYLSKHAGDPQADSISYQIAVKLLERKDYPGALAQADRSLTDFPFGKGKYAADVISLKARILTEMGRVPEAKKVIDDFLTQNPNSPVANNMLLTEAQGEIARKDYATALTDFQKVKSNPAASADIQAGADAGYIEALQDLGRYDDVITEAKAFEAKYPDHKSLPNIMLFAGMAMDHKHDPGAVAALQDLAKKYPKDASASFALFYVVTIYQHAGNVPAMIQATNDLRTNYPDAYALLARASDAVSSVLEKQKKFDDAIALYQPLSEAPDPGIAAAAGNKMGSLSLAAAKVMGYYPSLPPDVQTTAKDRLSTAEQSFLSTLKNYSDQLPAVGDAFDGLVNDLKQRRSWEMLKDADMEAYLSKLGADLTSPDMQTRLEMAKAGLVFTYKDGAQQYAAALDRFKKALAANPNLALTRPEADQFGQLLIAAKDYPDALNIYNNLLSNSSPADVTAVGYAYYGLGAAYLGQGDFANAKTYFTKLKALPDGARWHPHILDADFGLAWADEQTGQPADLAEAQQTYARLMQAQQAGPALMANAMIGYGRVLEKQVHTVSPPAPGSSEFAVHYYQEPNTIFGAAAPEQSAEGLFMAGQAYEKAGDKVNAKAQYAAIISTYATTAPDWVAKAQAAQAQLGP